MQVLSKLATGPSASSDVSGAPAWVLQQLGAPTTQRLKLTASAPIHAPYWRRRGLAGQIISPRPQSPYQPLGRPQFKPYTALPLCYLSRYVRDKRPQGRKQLTPEVPTTTCEVLKFKARDRDIESQFRCCDCVKFLPSHYMATPWDSESLRRKIFVKFS